MEENYHNSKYKPVGLNFYAVIYFKFQFQLTFMEYKITSGTPQLANGVGPERLVIN